MVYFNFSSRPLFDFNDGTVEKKFRMKKGTKTHNLQVHVGHFKTRIAVCILSVNLVYQQVLGPIPPITKKLMEPRNGKKYR